MDRYCQGIGGKLMPHAKGYYCAFSEMENLRVKLKEAEKKPICPYCKKEVEPNYCHEGCREEKLEAPATEE